jgi:hypothetical protein
MGLTTTPSRNPRDLINPDGFRWTNRLQPWLKQSRCRASAPLAGQVARAVQIDECAGQPYQLTRRRRFLPAAHGRLARWADRTARQLAERQLAPYRGVASRSVTGEVMSIDSGLANGLLAYGFRDMTKPA